MKSVSLNAFPRVLTRRGGVKKLRSTGRVPAVIYGRRNEPKILEVEAKDLENLIHHSASENVLVDLAIKEDAQPKRLALVQEVQHHVLTGKVLHVDFHEVAEDEKVILMVPVETVGEAAGVKTGGGVLEHVLFKVKVRALPKDLPEVLTVDVSHLNIGQSIHIGELPLPSGVEILGEKMAPVIAVALPKEEVEEVPAAGAEASLEPEVIREKKEEGEEEGEAKAGEKGGEKKGAEKKGEKSEKSEKTDKPEKAEKAEKKK